MKRSILSWVAAPLLLFPLLAAATTSPDELQQRLSDKQVRVSNQFDQLIAGSVDVTVSASLISDTEVAAFRKAYGYQPTLLTFATTDEHASERAPLASMERVYLYVHLRPQADRNRSLVDALGELMDDFAPKEDDETDRAEVPEIVRQQWRVRLGLVSPRFDSGYL